MPFDAAGFPHEPAQPQRPPSNDNVVTVIVVVISALLLATPLSLAACSDIVQYFGGR